jgi:hypothetical protein
VGSGVERLRKSKITANIGGDFLILDFLQNIADDREGSGLTAAVQVVDISFVILEISVSLYKSSQKAWGA